MSPRRSPPAVTTTGRTTRRISGPRSCWPAIRIELPFIPYFTDPSTEDKAHHESSSHRVSVGAADRFRDRNPVFAATTAQTPSPKETPPQPQGLRKLTGDDAKRAEELDKAIEAALKADRWDEAIAKAEELLALRARVQGPKHFETVTRGVATQDVAPGGADAAGGSSRLPIGQYHE